MTNKTITTKVWWAKEGSQMCCTIPLDVVKDYKLVPGDFVQIVPLTAMKLEPKQRGVKK